MRKQAPSPADNATGLPAAARSPRGVALLIAVLILFVVSVLGAAMVSLGRVDYELSGNYRSRTASLSLADSALQATAADLRADYNTDPAASALAAWANLNANPVTVVDPFPDPTGVLVNGHALTPATITPNPYAGTPYSMGTAVPLGSGTYSRTVWLPPTVSTAGGTTTLNFRVRSEGTDTNRATPATTIIDGVVTVDVAEAGGYSTAALFGRGDDAGDVMRGGIVQIAGPVAVIGDSSGATSTELRLRNFSSIVNSYAGIADATGLGTLASKVPPLLTQDYDGDDVAALNTTLHLQDAELILQPSAALGAPDEPGNGYKETLDGVFTDGAVDPDDANIHVDEVSPYDLGNVEFPSLSDPYTDPESGTSYSTYTAYLNTIAYAPLGGSDLEITAETASFSYIDPAGKGSLAWDASTETLTIDGVVKIDGAVLLGEAGGGGGGRGRGRGRGRGGGGGGGTELSAIKYDGTGVLWATDDIEINKDVYPNGWYLQDGPDAGTAVDGNLGLVTAGAIRLDAGSVVGNLQVFATLFAEERIDVRRRANIAGAIVTNHLNLIGGGRFNLWYVPGLAAAAPRGMPGALGTPTISVGITNWFQLR